MLYNKRYLIIFNVEGDERIQSYADTLEEAIKELKECKEYAKDEVRYLRKLGLDVSLKDFYIIDQME